MMRPESSFSDVAKPTIQAKEAVDAPDAICPWHNGLIARAPSDADKPGAVFFCPVGRQYWRYQPAADVGFRGRLPYHKAGAV